MRNVPVEITKTMAPVLFWNKEYRQDSGGGGYGDPHVRPAAKVADDVERGLVSKRSARDHYGVALTPDFRVDAAETAKLRTKVAAE